ncbi:unnamed protein product [Ilex paraguariensis]|uniref:Endonuclease/exonuclease/phosphatase domain-containing protein n=1 Tax=Ilex paraguariensis TaxID=185542 RepID=A0ABC8UG61_9AQUA
MLNGGTSSPRLSLSSSAALSTIFFSKMSTTADPLCRKFVPVEQSEITSISKPDGFKFCLVSYNILAQWKPRSQAILTVLKSLGADFICLQELDEYDSFYKRNIESHGYSSIYIQRSGQKRDGCGIFYKPNSSELVIDEKIDYNDLVSSVQSGATSCVVKNNDALLCGGNKDAGVKDLEPKNNREDRGDPNDLLVRLKHDCVGIMAAFRLKDPSGHLVIVANTHLYCIELCCSRDPEWADVKLAQAKYLLSRLAQFKMLLSHKFESTPSVIVAGDFNSVPGDKVCQYSTISTWKFQFLL